MSDVLEPPTPWVLRETGCHRETLGRTESLFALANGHLGLRGNLDEGEPRVVTGTYLNGLYESYPLEYGERGYGFAEDGQTIVNVPDGKVIRLLVENEPVDIERGTVERHERRLDLRKGQLEREMEWVSAYGDRVLLRSRRLVSFVQRSVAAIVYEVEALDRPLRVAVQSLMIGSEADTTDASDPRAARSLGDVLECKLWSGKDLRAVFGHTTRRTHLSVASGMDHVVHAPDGEARIRSDVEEDLARVTVSVRLEPGQVLRIEKVLAYHWSSRQTVDWLRDQVDASLENALAEGWDGLALQQRQFLDDFWARADIEIDGDDEVQQALRFALFHLIQAGARIEGRAIAAKGLTGTGYDGHAFWDTESFVLPALTYLEPRVVRDALEWRHSTLPQARDRAATLDLEGAVFPWRTIHGEECSGYWPAGQAAVHVNADIADAVRRYVVATDDQEFERGMGLELAVEIARLFADLGDIDHEGRFRIAGVTGPDEYSALGDDNVFTNLMARRALAYAADAVDRHPDQATELGVTNDDVEGWRAAAAAMHLPYNERLGIHPQHEGFLEYGVWDFDGTPADRYPLLLHAPYFELYRKQVVKQADLQLALWFCGDSFTDDEKRKDFDYYETITVRDSSLSAAAQAVVAFEVGHMDLGMRYLREAALTDLDDLHGNAVGGLHIASLGGAVLGVTNGLGGFRDHDGHRTFKPRLCTPLRKVVFRLQLGASRLRVTILRETVRYVVEDGPPLEITHWGEALTVGDDEVKRSVPPLPDLQPPSQPRHRAPAPLP